MQNGLAQPMPWLAYPQDANRKASGGRLVRPTLRGALLGLEIGTSQATLPVGVGRAGRTPHIALSGAFLALRASVCNRCSRRWVSGRRRDWDPGRTANGSARGWLDPFLVQALQPLCVLPKQRVAGVRGCQPASFPTRSRCPLPCQNPSSRSCWSARWAWRMSRAVFPQSCLQGLQRPQADDSQKRS